MDAIETIVKGLATSVAEEEATSSPENKWETLGRIAHLYAAMSRMSRNFSEDHKNFMKYLSCEDAKKAQKDAMCMAAQAIEMAGYLLRYQG